MAAPHWALTRTGQTPLTVAPLTLLTGDAAATATALTWIWAYSAEMALPNAPGGRAEYPALWMVIDAIAAERGAGAEAAGALTDAAALIAAHVGKTQTRLVGELFAGPTAIWTPGWADGPMGLGAADAAAILDQARRAVGMSGKVAEATSGLEQLAKPAPGRDPAKEWIEFFLLRWLMGGPPPAPPVYLPGQRAAMMRSLPQFQEALLRRLNDPAGRPPPAPLLDFLYRLSEPPLSPPLATVKDDAGADAALRRTPAPTLICWEQADAGLSPSAARDLARTMARLIGQGWRIVASADADGPLAQSLGLLAKLGGRGGPPPAGLTAEDLIAPGLLSVQALAVELTPSEG